MNILSTQNLIAPGELDPLNRRLGSQKKPDVVVQVVILAEDASIQEKLRRYDIQVQTTQEAEPIEVQPARVLSHLYTYLGTTWLPFTKFYNLNVCLGRSEQEARPIR